MLQKIFLAYHSIMWIILYWTFLNFMWKDKSLLEYINSFSTKKYEMNDKKILKYF